MDGNNTEHRPSDGTGTGPEATYEQWCSPVPQLAHSFEDSLGMDPVAAAAQLARADLGQQYIVDEREGIWHFAAGPSAEASVTADTLRLRIGELSDPKEIHEHAISVRLALGEVRAVSAEGTVSVTEFMEVEERGCVQHLASRVVGTLRAAESPWTALASLFSAVTVTGAPKANALRLIHELEGDERGLYGGAVLMLEPDGGLDAALTLRTVFHRNGRSWLRAGAGIMGQSTPDREWEETREKLSSIAPHLRGTVHDEDTR